MLSSRMSWRLGMELSLCVCVCMCVCVCVYACVYACVRVCIHVYLCVYHVMCAYRGEVVCHQNTIYGLKKPKSTRKLPTSFLCICTTSRSSYCSSDNVPTLGIHPGTILMHMYPCTTTKSSYCSSDNVPTCLLYTSPSPRD